MNTLFGFLFIPFLILSVKGFSLEDREDIEDCLFQTDSPWFEPENAILRGEPYSVPNVTSSRLLVSFSLSSVAILSIRASEGENYTVTTSSTSGENCISAPVFYNTDFGADVSMYCFDPEGCHVIYSFRDFYIQEEGVGGLLFEEDEEE